MFVAASDVPQNTSSSKETSSLRPCLRVLLAFLAQLAFACLVNVGVCGFLGAIGSVVGSLVTGFPAISSVGKSSTVKMEGRRNGVNDERGVDENGRNSVFDSASDLSFEGSTITLVNGDYYSVEGNITVVVIKTDVPCCDHSPSKVIIILSLLCVILGVLAAILLWKFA
ncbi:hypothetical protein K435DRAFT_855139 [Dendrothele bispora CBS 962.96]|uniref:Uncharacterized protein n=1 Tax=Dendrothele bispora (strain CBS 962.96) TaxID=1314807 RepID=A0A4S8MDD8_DENBC|nr:hypothetical protein K435DRAFT_855139 [Dendrothele bispora CBS 962.96]